MQFRVLQIMEHNTNYPKSLIINYIIIKSLLMGFLADQNKLLFEDCREMNFYTSSYNSLLPRHFLKIGVLQIKEHGMAK